MPRPSFFNFSVSDDRFIQGRRLFQLFAYFAATSKRLFSADFTHRTRRRVLRSSEGKKCAVSGSKRGTVVVLVGGGVEGVKFDHYPHYPLKSLTNQKYFVKTKHVFKKAFMSSFFDEIESQFSGCCRLQSCTEFSYNPWIKEAFFWLYGAFFCLHLRCLIEGGV